MAIRNTTKDDGEGMHNRLDQVLDSDHGFVIMYDGEKVTDAFDQMCPKCILNVCAETIDDAYEKGMLPEPSEC